MTRIIPLLILLFSSAQAWAIDFSTWDNWDVTKWNKDTKLLDVNEVFIDYQHYTWAIEPFMAGNNLTPTNALDLHVNFDMLNHIMFMDNMIHSETDQYQYALVGWNYKVGFHMGRYIDVFFQHYSQHLLDVTPVNGSNTYDAVGFRLYLYRR